ncbi:clathrin interactor 1-like [Diadema antillarum]|uniref:clathrin interactor 1-like n=1 Tax=Diadema antillarum TaxID=105358 RepID=UPI003A8B73B8
MCIAEKSLLLLQYLILNGSERVVTSAREHLYDLKGLESYSFLDEFNRDQGLNVRQKVKDIIKLIQDDEALRAKRKQARKAKDKYTGYEGSTEGGGYSDRYDRQPKSSWLRNRDNENELDEEWNRKSAGDKTSRKGDESDESPAEYVDDESDEDAKPSSQNKNSRFEFRDEEEKEERITSTTTTERRTKTTKKRSGKRVDLGAAAVYAAEAKEDSGPASQNSNDLVSELFDSGIAASVAPITNTAAPPSQSVDLFADFSSAAANDSFGDFNPRADTSSGNVLASASQSTTSPNGDFADFSSFQSTPAPGSSADKSFGEFKSVSVSQTQQMQSSTTLQSNLQLLSMDAPLQPSGGQGLMQPQPIIQPQPTMQPQMSSMGMLQPQQSLELDQPQIPQQVIQPPLQQDPQQSYMSGLPAEQQAQYMYYAVATQMNQGMGMMGQPQGMMGQPQGMMGQPQGMMGQSQPSALAAGSTTPSKSKIWSDSKVNISLDSLSPGDRYKKQSQPSMNQLQQQGVMSPGGQPNYNMSGMMSPPPGQPSPQMGGMMSGMAQMNLGSPMGQPTVPAGAMQGSMGATAGMRPQQPMMMGQPQMGMGMGMGMAPAGMGMMGQQQYGAYGAK